MHKSMVPISLLALVAVSPAQAAPTQITACGTISQPGSYVLAQNLSPFGGGDCLVIAIPIPATFGAPSNFVTIDLAGFMITGDGTGTGIIRGIAPRLGNPTLNITEITVRNGTITGFHSGVDLSGGICVPLNVNGVITCNPSRLGERTFERFDVVEGLRVTTSFGPDEEVNGGFGISASGIVRDNQVFAAGKAVAIIAKGRVTGNVASAVRAGGTGMTIFSDSTVIGNNVLGSLTVSCPSNVTDNTTRFGNFVLEGQGCNNTNNVAP
jgi:hypothetical protein